MCYGVQIYIASISQGINKVKYMCIYICRDRERGIKRHTSTYKVEGGKRDIKDID